MALWCLPALAATPVDRPPQELVIGWWQMDVKQAPELKALGVNTAFGVVNYGGVMSKGQYEDALAARGMGFVTEPDVSRLATEASQPMRKGWLQKDEIDLSSHVNKPGYTLADFAAIYRTCKGANAALPVYINFAGSGFDNLYYDGRKIRTDIPGNVQRDFWHYAADGGAMAYGDRVSFDYHLWTTGRPGAFFLTRRLLDRLWDWSGGKDTLLYVETCPQGKPIAYTADDYESQVMEAVVWCAQRGIRLRGIIYFSHTFKSNGAWTGFDGTSPEVKARMGEVHRRLNAWVAGNVATTVAATQPTSQPAAVPTTQPTTQPEPTPAPVQQTIEERVTALEAWRRAMTGGN